MARILSAKNMPQPGIVQVVMDTGAVWFLDTADLSRTEVHRALRDWLDAGNLIADADPPAPPPMPALTARQLRLGLLRLGVAEGAVRTAVANIPDPTDRATAEIELGHSNVFEWDHPVIRTMIPVLLPSLSPSAVEAAWRAASEL